MQHNDPNLENDPLATSVTTTGIKSNATVLGDFEIHREIGRGGMGTVYEALQVSLQRIVALKVLAPHVASTSKAVSRFRREAQAAAKLHHTHIVPIFAQGEAEGSYFYAMELVEGESLHAVIMNLRSQHRPEAAADQAETIVLPQRSASGAATTRKISAAGPSDSSVRKSGSSLAKSQAFGADDYFQDAARHLADVADALEYAHLNGVIHRDIKPHNLLFGRDSRLRISDFGLARLAEQPGVTMTGEVLGSPLYMSPEQITGDPGAVDHRTDIYSLGATMYEWLTLNPPYPGETRERVINKILSTEPLPPRSENPSIPHDLETICLKAIDRDLNRRYQTAGEMRDDLRRFLLSRPIVARRAGTMVRAMRFIIRHQIAALLTAALVVGSGLLWALYSKDRRVKVEQAEAVKAKAEAVEAKEAIVDAQSNSDILYQFLNAVVPGGGALAEKVATAEVPGAGLPTGSIGNLNFTLRIGAPSEIALRAVGEFYQSVVSPDWPEGNGVSEADAAKVNSALSRWAAGDAKGAEQILSEYIAALPSKTADPEAVQMRAALNAVLGQFDAMLDDADVLLSGGANPNGYIWRGLARLMLNQAESSLKDLDRASLGQKSVWTKIFRGLALLQAEKSDEAKGLFEDVLRDAPSSIAARLGRAKALTAEGDYASALPEVELVLKADPKNIHALTIRGDCRVMTGDLDGALRDFKEAVSIAGPITELLARCYGVIQAQKNSNQNGEAQTLGNEVKSRHGTEPEDKSAPPVFKWLRQRLPENESGAMQPESSMLPWASFRFPLLP